MTTGSNAWNALRSTVGNDGFQPLISLPETCRCGTKKYLSSLSELPTGRNDEGKSRGTFLVCERITPTVMSILNLKTDCPG